MSKKKHTKKNSFTPRRDANENVRNSLIEKKRLMLARQKRLEKLRAEYEKMNSVAPTTAATMPKKEDVVNDATTETTEK